MPNYHWQIIIIGLVAFGTIAIVADRIFEHVPHSEDEVAYLFQAKVLAQNRLTVPTPRNAAAFWSPFVVDYQGVRFGKYPPGWPLLLSLGVRLGVPWLINALLAVLTLTLIAQLGREFYSPIIGLGAAELGLVTPGFLFLSSSLLSHAVSLFWVTVALWAFFRLTQASGRSAFYAVIVGGALGAAFITRPFAALGVGLVLGLFLLTLLLRGEVAWSILPWLVWGGLSLALLLPLYGWAISGSPTFNPYLLVWPYDRLGFGPEVGPHGYTLHDAIFINTHLKLMALTTGLFGWPGWSNLLFLPIPFLSRQANRWDGLLLGLSGGVIFIHIFYWAFGGVDGGFPRYYYEALPAFLLLTTRGIYLLGQSLDRLQPRLRYLPLLLVITFVIYNFFWTLPPLLAAQKGKYNITPEPLQVVEEANLAKPALIIVKKVESWSDFAAPFTANSPTLDGEVVYAIDWNPALTQQVRAQFAGRHCWELQGQRLSRCPDE